MFEVACDTAVAPDPGEGALHDPSFRQDGEAFRSRIAAHDLQRPLACLRDRCGGGRSLISLVGEHDLDEGKAPAGVLVEHPRRPVAILHVRRMDHDPQHQAKRVDEQVLLDALGLLARVIAGFLRFAPPFSADFAVRQLGIRS
jgi:hypothetical protein